MTLKFDFKVALIVLAAGLLIAIATAHGVAVSPDVVYYIGGARGILSEGRYILPTFHGDPILNYPPVTSLILAIGGWLTNWDLFSVGRGMDVLFFGLSTGIVWIAIRHHTRSALLAFSGAILFAFSNDIIAVHLRVWSEPAFITASLGGLFYLSKFFEEGRRKDLYFASFILTLAIMTRYLGITLFMSGGLCLLLVGRTSLKVRFLNLVRFGVMPTLVFGGWLLRNRILSGQSTNRVYHPGYITWDRVMIYLDQAAGAWFLPVQFPSWFRAGVFLGVCGFLIFAALKVKNRPWAPYLIYPIIFYTFLNITQVTTGDGYPDDYAPEYRRYFSTIHGPFLVGAIILGWSFFKNFPHQMLRRVATVGLAVLVLLTSARGSVWVYQAYREGHNGSTVEAIQNSELSKRLSALPKDSPVYFIGGHREQLFVQAFHNSKMIPGTETPHESLATVPTELMNQLISKVREPNSQTIYFGPVDSISSLKTEYPIISKLPLKVRDRFSSVLVLVSSDFD
jgi:hypothetical protein